MIAILIPARLNSERLPRKLLLDVGGRPLLWHTVQRAMEARADYVAVLTEDQEIFDVMAGLKVPVVLTAPAASGTERIARFVLDLLRRNELSYNDVIVNFQGDEPELSGSYAMVLADVVRRDPLVQVATLASPATVEESSASSVVKVVVDRNSDAMYFSRCPIPYGGRGFRHIGLYAYRPAFFESLRHFPPMTTLASERLEQLQWLENGVKIRVLFDHITSVGIDTMDDYECLLRRLGCANRLQADSL